MLLPDLGSLQQYLDVIYIHYHSKVKDYGVFAISKTIHFTNSVAVIHHVHVLDRNVCGTGFTTDLWL